MIQKKHVLGASLLYVVYAIAAILGGEFCDSGSWCKVHDDDILGQIFFIFFPLLATLFLSLITLKMREEAFRAWWNFARWIVPVIIIATIWVNSQQTGRGFFNLDALGYPLILGPLYLALIIVSLWKIMRVYRTPVVMKEK